MRRVEEKAMVALVYGKDDGKDRDVVGIKVGDFSAKSEWSGGGVRRGRGLGVRRDGREGRR